MSCWKTITIKIEAAGTGGGGGEIWGGARTGAYGHTLVLVGGGTKDCLVWNSAEGISTGSAGLAAGLLGSAALLSGLCSGGSGAAAAGKAGLLPGTTSLIVPAIHMNTHLVYLLIGKTAQSTICVQQCGPHDAFLYPVGIHFNFFCGVLTA